VDPAAPSDDLARPRKRDNLPRRPAGRQLRAVGELGDVVDDDNGSGDGIGR
jgi:hypothetical protein